MEILICILILILAVCLYLLFNPAILLFDCIIGNRFSGALIIKFAPFKYKIILSKKGEKAKVKIISKEDSQKEKPVKSGKKRKIISYWQLILDEFDTIKIVLIAVVRFIGRLLISPDRYFLNISAKGGLGSPDITGEVYGAIESIKPILGKSVSIAYQPDFIGGSLDANIIAGVEIRIISIIKEMLIFIWKLPKLGIIRIIRKLRKGGRNAKQTSRTPVIDNDRA